MKKFLLIAIAFFTFAACDDEDNSALWDEVKNQGNKIEMLESEIEALKVKIEGLNQTFKAITEMLNGGLITAVEEVTDGDKSGYKFTIQTFDEAAGAQINTYTIWNGESIAGLLGVEKDEENGQYYWTLGSEPVVDADGNKVYTSTTPKLKIEDDGNLYISYDGGATYEKLGVFNGTVTAGSDIQVVKNGNVVVIKQEGKADIEIPITPTNTLDIEFPNIDADAGMRVMKNGVYLVEYELKNASANAYVKAEALNGTNFDVVNFPAEKKFKIAAKGQMTSDVILVHVYDGTVCRHRSFNIAPAPAIKAITISEPEVNFSLADISGNFEYMGQLTLAEAATENITLAVVPAGAPAGAFTTEGVTINRGSTTGTYKVIVKRSALSAEISYTVPLVFSTENSNYHVAGETEMTVMKTATLQKIKLTPDMLESKYTHSAMNDGGNIGVLCDGLLDNDFWGSNWSNPPAADPIYGVFIDITLPNALYFVKFRYYTRYNTNNAVPTAIVVGAYSGTDWEQLFSLNLGLPQQAAVWWDGDVQHSLPDNSSFNKIRFGITASAKGDLIETPSNSTALSELEVWGLY